MRYFAAVLEKRVIAFVLHFTYFTMLQCMHLDAACLLQLTL